MHPTLDAAAIRARGALRTQGAALTLFGRIDAKLFAVPSLATRARHHRQLSSLRAHIHVTRGVIDELFARKQSAPFRITQLWNWHVSSNLFVFTSFDYFFSKVSTISHHR